MATISRTFPLSVFSFSAILYLSLHYDFFSGLPTTSTASKSTQIGPSTIATLLMSEVTTTFISKVTDTAEIMASKTNVPASISPKPPTSAEKQVYCSYIIE